MAAIVAAVAASAVADYVGTMAIGLIGGASVSLGGVVAGTLIGATAGAAVSLGISAQLPPRIVRKDACNVDS